MNSDPDSEYRPQPQPQPEARARENPEFTSERQLSPAYLPPPRLNGDEPQETEKKKEKGGKTLQSIAAAVILAIVAGVAIWSQVPHHTDGGTSSQQSSQSSDSISQGRITVSVDGQLYGTFRASQSSLILNTFIKRGDTVTVTCVSLPQGSDSVVARIGTTVRVYESRPLHAGEQQTWGVRAIPKGGDPGNYASGDTVKWFVAQAAQGNPVAEYGVGNMCVVGIDGVTANYTDAAMWFQRAANQHFANAADRVAELQKPAPPVK